MIVLLGVLWAGLGPVRGRAACPNLGSRWLVYAGRASARVQRRAPMRLDRNDYRGGDRVVRRVFAARRLTGLLRRLRISSQMLSKSSRFVFRDPCFKEEVFRITMRWMIANDKCQ
jgi:hypothetical protein